MKAIKCKKKNAFFTLIELLVVIVIIGILAGVIMISTSSSIDKASVTKLKVFEESVQNNLAANMVSRWKMDEIINTNKTPDTWGSNTGTLYGTNGLPQVKTSGCVTGNCLAFDGIDDYIEITDSQEMRMVHGGTITAWINPKTCGENGWGRLIDKSVSTSAGNGYMIWFELNYIKFQTSGSSHLLSSSSLKFNSWQFVTVSFNNFGRRIYIDGVNVTASGGSDTLLPPDIAGVVSIGNRASASDRTFDGEIDDVRIYDAALSIGQIKQKYVAGLNSLLSSGNILKEDYNQRISSLSEK